MGRFLVALSGSLFGMPFFPLPSRRCSGSTRRRFR
jgi:hypothetical protein